MNNNQFDFSKIGYTAIPNWVDDTFISAKPEYIFWFRWLIKNANKSEIPNQRLIAGLIVNEEQFEYAFTISYACKSLKTTHQKFRSFLNNLSSLSVCYFNVIEHKSTNKYTLIKLCEPITYVFNAFTKKQTKNKQKTNKKQTKNEEITTTKETNKFKETNKINNNKSENFSKKIEEENYKISQKVEEEIDKHTLIFQFPKIKKLFIKTWIEEWFNKEQAKPLAPIQAKLHLNNIHQSLLHIINENENEESIFQKVKLNLETAITQNKFYPYSRFTYGSHNSSNNRPERPNKKHQETETQLFK